MRFILGSVVAQEDRSVTVNAMVVGWTRGMKYLIFYFSRSGNETKRSVEFHLTRHAMRIQRKVES